MEQSGRELLILGLLRRKPMSAYHVEKAVRGHAHLYRPLRTGNVYDTLERFASEGALIRRTVKADRGPRQTKTAFRLSAQGERRFKALLHEVLTDVQTVDWVLEIAYVLIGQLQRKDALDLFTERLLKVTQHERRFFRLRGDISDRTGAGYLSGSHAIIKMHAESRFLRDSIALLKDPKWTSDWDLHEPRIDDNAFDGEVAGLD